MEYQDQQVNKEQEIRISDYLRIINQYRYIVVSVFVLVLGLTILYTAKQPRIYSTSAKILLEDSKNKSELMFLTSRGITPTTINNQIELIRSTPVAAVAWQIMQKYKDSDAFPLKASSNPVARILGSMSVASKRETDILTIGYLTTNPLEAMAAANSIAEALQQQNTQYARLEFTNIREFLESQLDAISRRLQTSEEDLRAFKIENGLTELSEETRQLITKSSEIEANYQAAKTDAVIRQKTLNFLNRRLQQQDTLLTDINNILSTPYIDELRKQIVETQAMITKLLAKNEYSVDHPQIILLNREIENTKAKLDMEVRKMINSTSNSDPVRARSDLITQIISAQIELEIANAKSEGFKSTTDLYNQQIAVLPDNELELARLTRNMAIDEKIHTMMVEKYEDTKVAEQAKMGNVRIIERATIPTSPIKPRVSTNILVGIIIGLGLGIGTAFLIHSLDTKLRTLDDIETYVRLPIVGTIPIIQESITRVEDFNRMIEQAEGESREQLIKSLHFVMMQLVSHYAPKSPVAESYRTLRTNMVSKKHDGPLTLLVTSSGPKEGKSTTIANLAITLAQMNSRVILIDCDLRRPMIHTKFSTEKENGSSDYLIDPDIQLDMIVKPSGILNLDLITSGFVPPNPSELISSPRMEQMIAELKQNYDFILFDTPPIIAVTDALILTKKVDMTFIVVRIDYTEKGIIKRTKELIDNVAGTIDGIIINGINAQKYYSKQSYYYYYYFYYYGDEVPQKQKKSVNKFLRKNKSIS